MIKPAEHNEASRLPTSSANARNRWPRLAEIATWLLLVGEIGVWLSIYLGGDHWWWATVLLFSPRWLLALPLLPLLPAALLCRKRVFPPFLFASAVVLGPLMGLCLPWQVAGNPTSTGPAFKVMTCNVHVGLIDREAFRAVVLAEQPDVIAFQEANEAIVRSALPDGEWYVDDLIASRLPINSINSLKDDGTLGHWAKIVTHYRLKGRNREINLFNLHLETPRVGFEALRDHGLAGRHELRSEIKRRKQISAAAREFVRSSAGEAIVVGDFNMPVDSRIYREHWSDMQNAFSRAGTGFGYTVYHKWTAARIDHILSTENPSGGWVVDRCWIGDDVGSDHRPLIAEFRWQHGL